MFAIDSATFSTSAAQSLTHKYDLKQRKGALHCVRAWAAKGYQPIYLSGRQVTTLAWGFGGLSKPQTVQCSAKPPGYLPGRPRAATPSTCQGARGQPWLGVFGGMQMGCSASMAQGCQTIPQSGQEKVLVAPVDVGSLHAWQLPAECRVS